MAVSYRLVIFLLVLIVGGVFWGLTNAAVDEITPHIEGETDTSQGEQLLNSVGTMWLIVPLMILIASGAWALKQAILTQI